MQNFTISIGTSQDALDLADGLPLFPKVGTARAGISNTAQSSPLVDGSVTVLFLRTTISAYYEFLMGVIGPAVSFKFPGNEVALNNPPGGGGEVTVALGSDQKMIAGMAIGFVVGAGLTVSQEIYLPSSWYAPWKFAWRTVFELSLHIEIDFIKLLLELIQYLLGESGKDGYLTKDTSGKLTKYLGFGSEDETAESFKFYAESDGSLGPDRTISATPKYAIPIDLMNSIPVAKNFMKLLATIVGEVQFGPCLEIHMPVTLGLTGFTVTGGQGAGAPPATYSPITYNGSTATAHGASFSSPATRFTTDVAYTTGFTVAVSYFFQISVMKVFNVQVNTGSLDLLNLLNLQVPPYEVPGSVSTEIATGCILTPQMSIAFSAGANASVPPNTVIAGSQFSCEVFLNEPWAGDDTHITLSIYPEVAEFPMSVPIRHGNASAIFKHTIPNQLVIAGDPSDSTAKVPPSSTAPYQSYLVTATLPPNDLQPCFDWEVTAPLKLLNRVLSVKFYSGTSGEGPVWNPQAGAVLNADPNYPPQGVFNGAAAFYSFPSVPGQTSTEAPITISLYNDERKLHPRSDVWIIFSNGKTAKLAPSATLTLPIPANTAATHFAVEWRSMGEPVNYSSRFYLVFDGGEAYGQTEFWLTVWNWS
ncbi:hypothetical protein ACPOL_2600 [Acidisarcina polymorpha]|uniref:Uncharacterized protein n=1 Tax=Acidisarcina polymorpha TaxID=2211140 RepID=A0A2Z5G006_9BACT|nr:hypothetical protein [Acidisarcina polymorpha]AXC11916.1 hypothetical protein ACPOL_2600 [Acidisarcina polymorpha]